MLQIRFDTDADDVTAADLLFDDEREELDGPPEPAETPQARAARLRRDAARRSREHRERARLAADTDAALVDAMLRVSRIAREAAAREGRPSLDTPFSLGSVAKLAFVRLRKKGIPAESAKASILARLKEGGASH
ncbi:MULTISPECIES: hypothetical protein [Methylobacterium]|uniref:Uncharacterized protein n=3 Tax=Methylobacterium TaxID=407 RepID=A0A2R4WM10_9HYPH|nr:MULTISPECIES: hypothetical protein [Methylobacterium]AWB22587.1 hypothetical protein DA075_18110 [Methylobacterium currus]MBK3397139.1 hypothetical protein [Methylobacterium ajmalii]MBK3408354.1 hypothetical protein [Methylobacterium ajmalii]MBZ6411070.1 hypothetical protein [Methylobacterium sp.]